MDIEKLNPGQAKAITNQIKNAREEKFLEESRKRLDKIVTTKMKTSFIGALAAFEEEFGFLWGQGVEECYLTEEQMNMRELWEKTRTVVLNNGNTQLRAVKNEISNHVIKWNRYRTEFIIIEDGENYEK